MVKVRGVGGGWVSIAGVACYRPDERPHLFYHLLVYRRRKGEPKGFAWQDYRDLITAAHRQLSAPLVWVWDNLNIHLGPELADFAAADLNGLVRIVKRKLKKIQYWPHLIDGCLTVTGLQLEP